MPTKNKNKIQNTTDDVVVIGDINKVKDPKKRHEIETFNNSERFYSTVGNIYDNLVHGIRVGLNTIFNPNTPVTISENWAAPTVTINQGDVTGKMQEAWDSDAAKYTRRALTPSRGIGYLGRKLFWDPQYQTSWLGDDNYGIAKGTEGQIYNFLINMAVGRSLPTVAKTVGGGA